MTSTKPLFPLTIATFTQLFNNYTAGWTWAVQGFLDSQGYVHPIDTDTKVISTVFERLASPVIRTIAAEAGYVVELANQTTYPDFTLSAHVDGTLKHRIAIDVKTTYFSGRMGFTLGGYNSFIRNDTKNILHPYSTYHEHWIIGFIYRQLIACPEYDLLHMPKPGEIACPYEVVSIFIREKHSISGLRAGSGNTKNIGSVTLRESDAFSTVEGPFLQFLQAKAACDHYWRNYETLINEIRTAQELLNHPDFGHFR